MEWCWPFGCAILLSLSLLVETDRHFYRHVPCRMVDMKDNIHYCLACLPPLCILCSVGSGLKLYYNFIVTCKNINMNSLIFIEHERSFRSLFGFNCFGGACIPHHTHDTLHPSFSACLCFIFGSFCCSAFLPDHHAFGLQHGVTGDICDVSRRDARFVAWWFAQAMLFPNIMWCDMVLRRT